MLFSTQTEFLAPRYGLEAAVDMLIEAGYPAIDISMFKTDMPPFTDDYREVAARLLEKANAKGVKFIQAHAPFGGGYKRYTEELIPLLPRAFEFCGLLGIENIVVHPIQNGRYYGREKELFDMNVEFYRSLAPLAKKHGVKIAIENMWQWHPVNRTQIIDDICAPPEELAAMYDTLADPEAFTVCLDIGHVALCGREPEAAIRTIGSRIGCLHVHDVNYREDLHTLPGVSKINWDNVCRALAEIGYSGSINLEADAFYYGFLPEQHKIVTRFMADTTRILAEKVDFYR
ncbi:MAG: sugar phosphate isomerase/epimerase [Ruminococcaceae bacterium]|nr:sugar phosphate isomerase/epimerase [Oscillospiraceae bacterium]